jgi:Tol biopolymer transport system component
MFVAAGCGRIGFNEVARDAAGDVSLGTGPFGDAQLLDINSPTADDDPALTGDALEMLFDSERGGGSDLYVTRRASVGAPWSMPVLVPELSSGDDEDGPMLTADGLMVTFSSTRTGGPGLDDIWYSTRPNRDSAWAPVQLVDGVNSTASDEHMTITADKLYAVLLSLRSGTREFYSTRRESVTDAWGPLELMSELSGGSFNNSPCLDPAGTYLIFASNRNGSQAVDLFVATRSSRDEPFGTPIPVDELSTGDDESDPSIANNRHVLAFTRGVTTDRDIYLSER